MQNYSAEIKALEEANFGSCFIDLSNFAVEVVTKENNLAGYIIYQAVLEETEIISIYVKPEYRRQGLATKLLNNVKNKYQEIFLEVNENNQVALSLYEHLGFVIYNTRPKYYHNRDAAILMKWSR